MIVVLTCGEYSDYGLEDVIEVDVSSQEEFDTLVSDWKEANPAPEDPAETLRRSGWTNDAAVAAYGAARDKAEAWKAKLREFLLSSGVGRPVTWTELHSDEHLT